MRIVVSLTTIPKRIDKIRNVLQSILQQSRKADKIYINIPEKTLKGEKYKIPKFISENREIEIVRCQDYGAITKLLPILNIEREPTTRIITFDDDNIVHKDVLKIFEKRAKVYGNSALSFSGWCLSSFPSYIQLYDKSERDIEVDWIQGCHGIMYTRGTLDFDEIKKFRESLPLFIRQHDDHVLSGYLSLKGVKRISLKEDWKKYFRECDYRRVDSISGKIFFKFQVMCICAFFSFKGLYNKSPHFYENTLIVLPLIWFVLSFGGKFKFILLAILLFFSRLLVPQIRSILL